MVVGHTGRKSGLRHQTPVNYAQVNGDVYCTACLGSRRDWYRNLLANPEVEVWLRGPSDWRAGFQAGAAEEDPAPAVNRQRCAARLAAINPR